MKLTCSLITVSDIARARDFYERILNQKVKYDFGENITYHGDFAIHLRSHFQGLIDNNEIKTRSNSFELYFENNDLEELVTRLDSYGVTYIHGIREQPWRQKVMRFYDPDENLIEVGESMEHLSYRLYREGLTVEKIADITYMPEAFVIESIVKFVNGI